MVPKLHSRTLNSRSENMCTIYFTRHYWSTFQNMCMNSNPTSNVWVSLSVHSFTCCIYRESSTHMTMSSSQKITFQLWFSQTPGLILHLSVHCTLCCLPRQRSKSHFHLLRPILMSLARTHVVAGFLHIAVIDILDKLVLYLEWGLVLFSF